jgi:membrane-associated phospholipid phosphatase
VVVIGGANVTAQVLQHDVFTRPEVSPGVNGLPSQHMTVALSLSLAAIIVARRNWRSTVAIGVSAAATLVGVALVLGRWHRPSDVIAAVLLCVVWAAVGLLVAGLVRRRPPTLSSTRSTVTLAGASLVGAWTVSVLLVAWGARPPPGLPDLGLAVISIGSIGVACALSVAAVARVADRHLG